MKTNEKTKALIIGGSMAGLLTARVLSDHFEEVIIVERDPVHDYPESRKGQAHTRHIHALLASGYQIINRLFPGIREELLAGGALEGDFGAETRWYQFDVWKKQFKSDLFGCTTSRPYLEWHVRRRVLALPNVQLLSPCEVKNLLISEDKSQVVGAQIIHRLDGREVETISTDLVVDCSGRGSAAPKWLEEWGYKRPEESRVKVNFAYSTRIYRRQPTDLPGANLIMVAPTPPAKTGTFMFPIEEERWIVTAGGVHGVEPPTDEAGYLEYIRKLPVLDIYNIISRAEALSDIIPYKFPYSLRRHYEKMRRFPAGYLLLGDALASFNPVYGQGMSSAAMQAAVLEKLLSKQSNQPDLWQTYFKQAARVVAIPWQIAVGEDFRWAETEGPKPPGTDLINRYIAHLARLMAHDTVIYAQFIQVMNLLAQPSSLLHPHILWRALPGMKQSAAAIQVESQVQPAAND
jgi:2-polyprenyl-6-methoxyphenol hydroxylase-like FAD-dependent oxidoreductase